MPVMEEALFVSAAAVETVEFASALPAGFAVGEEESDDDDYDASDDEESENGDEPIYGSSSPSSSSSVRFRFSSDDFLSCTLQDGPGCSVHCLDKGSFGLSRGGCLWGSSSHASACDKDTTSLCQIVGYVSLCCSSFLHDDRRSFIHGSAASLIDDGYICSTSHHTSPNVKQVALSHQTTEYASLGCHSGPHLNFEREKSTQHSSCGFIDCYACSTSSYCNANECYVVSSCCTAGWDSITCHCGLHHSSEGETDMKLPASARVSNGCKYRAVSQTYEDENLAASSFHVASCSCIIGHDGSCVNSKRGTCNTFLSFEEESALNHFSQSGITARPVHEKNNALSIFTESNDKSGVRHGSSSHCGLLHCPLQLDKANAFGPYIQGTSIRRNFIAQDTEGLKSGPKDSLCSRHIGYMRGRELGKIFQLAVDHLDWQIAEDLIPLADKQRLNDWLCIAVDSFWFLCTHKELCSATQIMEKLVKAGADCFMRAALRTSFLASCVWACQNRTRDLFDTVNVVVDRLHEGLQDCSGYELSSAEAVEKVKGMAKWALKCIVLHCRVEKGGYDGGICPCTPLGAQLQLRAFKRFLELADNRLLGEDYTEAFEAACFPLSLFSFVLDSGWASGIAASAMQGLLGMLVEGGADNVNQCCLEAARSGSTELLRMLLQIAQRNGIEVDVDMALGYASHHCKLGTMECLVDVGNAASFLDPLIRASDRGCMPVVQWFVEKGCQDTELCWGLTAAMSSNRVEVVEYLLKCIPFRVLSALSLDIIKAAAEHSGGCLKGIAFLFEHDFLCDPEATYDVADRISKLEDCSVVRKLKIFCKHEWSNEAFIRSRQAGKEHYLNVQRVLHHGFSPLQLKELPSELQIAIAYLPLYKECASSGGILLSQRLRGQLIEAAMRLGKVKHDSVEKLMKCNKCELIAVLKARLPTFLVERK